MVELPSLFPLRARFHSFPRDFFGTSVMFMLRSMIPYTFIAISLAINTILSAILDPVRYILRQKYPVYSRFWTLRKGKTTKKSFSVSATSAKAKRFYDMAISIRYDLVISEGFGSCRHIPGLWSWNERSHDDHDSTYLQYNVRWLAQFVDFLSIPPIFSISSISSGECQYRLFCFFWFDSFLLFGWPRFLLTHQSANVVYCFFQEYLLLLFIICLLFAFGLLILMLSYLSLVWSCAS